MPIVRVPAPATARAETARRARHRVATILRDLDLPAAPWQIVLAARLAGVDDVTTIAFGGLTRTRYDDVVEIVDDLVANRSVLEVLLGPTSP